MTESIEHTDECNVLSPSHKYDPNIKSYHQSLFKPKLKLKHNKNKENLEISLKKGLHQVSHSHLEFSKETKADPTAIL